MKGRVSFWPRDRKEGVAKAAIVGAVIGVLLGWVWASPLGSLVERGLQHPVDFQIRHALGQGPALSKKLLLFGIGDSTLGDLQSSDIELEEWGKLFVALEKAGASEIIVDKIFSFSGPGAASFRKSLESMKHPPVAAGLVHVNELKGRHPADPRSFALPLAAVAGGRAVTELPLDSNPWKFYGSHPDIAQALPRLGHQVYNSDGLVPFLAPVETSWAVPSLAWHAAGAREFKDGRFLLDGNPVPLDGDGQWRVNFAHPSLIASNLRKFSNLVQVVRRGTKFEIPSGSVVLILTSVFSGGAHAVVSPFGPVPLGYVQASLVNSVLTGQHIKNASGGFLWVLLSAVLGAIAGWWLRGAALHLGWTLGTLALWVWGTVTFAYYGSELPWVFQITTFLTGCWTVGTWRWAQETLRQRALATSLEGIVPSAKIAALVKGGREPRLLDPTNRVVTVFFIDIVGFSLVTERKSPKEVFGLLGTILAEITECVHRHGGIVDKTLGDGVLCFFGVLPDGTPTDDHADCAVRCAIELQQKSAERAARAPAGEPVFPFRIGINSAAVTLGDLGATKRVDLTVLGPGVNMAKRLEMACEPFGVLYGGTTASLLLRPQDIGAKSHKRLIPVKHFSEPYEAYEIDPLESRAELKKQALATHREFAHLHRKEDRFALKGELPLDCGALGKGVVVNASRSGLSVKLPRYLGQGLLFNAQLTLPGHDVPEIIFEVRWARPLDDFTFLHGLLIKNYTEAQKDQLFAQLKNQLGSVEPFKRAA
jgi:class 3 adenylate cyclase